jgi:sugar phosphate isomerase/epimerase
MEIGINVFSVYEQLGKDYLATLSKIAEAGYNNVELLGFNFAAQSSFRELYPALLVSQALKEVGLKAVAVHEGPMPGMDVLGYDWSDVLDYYDKLDCRRIVLPSVIMNSRESALRLAEQLDSIGGKLKRSGFTLYLHNHAHEFMPAGEGTGTLFDLLMDNTDPEHVKVELDVVWAQRAGLDPLVLLEGLGSRCDMIHQKDYSRSLSGPLNMLQAIIANGDGHLPLMELYGKYSKPGDFTDLGEGGFNFDAFYSRVKELGHVRYALVENEGQTLDGDKFKSIARDLMLMQRHIASETAP